MALHMTGEFPSGFAKVENTLCCRRDRNFPLVEVVLTNVPKALGMCEALTAPS